MKSPKHQPLINSTLSLFATGGAHTALVHMLRPIMIRLQRIAPAEAGESAEVRVVGMDLCLALYS